MTDRFSALVVVLDDDIREDDAQCIINAISMVKRVKSVTGHVASIDEHVAEVRVRSDLSMQLMAVLHPHLATKKS